MNSNIIFIETERLYLKPLSIDFLTEDYVQWLNDPEICKYNSHYIFPYTIEKAKSYIELISKDNSKIVLAIVKKEDNKHIGNVALQQISFFNQNAELAILLGSKEEQGKGYAYEATKAIMEHGFKSLGLHRIFCGTSIENSSMQRLALKLGFKQEGILKDAMRKNGNFVDIVQFGVVK